jgi:hypothetical protein
MSPLLLPLIYIIIIMLIFENIVEGKLKQPVLNYAFPVLITFGIMISAG